MRRIESLLLAANRVIVAMAIAAIFLIVFANVVGRYGFGTSLPWAEEVARFLMIFATFAGAGLALREGRLVAIDTLVAMVGSRPALYHAIRWLGVALMAVFMGLLVWYGVKFVQFGWNKETMALQISRGIPYLAIPVGASLFLLHLAFFARRYVHGQFDDDDEELHAGDASQ